MTISVHGMKVQGDRINLIAQNIANAGSLPTNPNDQPYRRQVIFFENDFDRELGLEVVKVDKIDLDDSPFGQRYEPGHPAANANGYVQTPNVKTLIEMQDMKEARRSYEANLGMITQATQMYSRTVDLLSG